MDVQVLVCGALMSLGVAYVLFNRESEPAHQEIPIPVPVDHYRR